MKRRLTVLVWLIALLLNACAPQSNEPQPPEILYGDRKSVV